MSRSKPTKAEQAKIEEETNELRKLLPIGTTVYTVLRHVSRSGMMRHIDLYVIVDGEPRWISYETALILGYPTNDRDGSIKVGGCGMDMGFHIVYGLSRRLHQGRFTCTGKGCRSNDHFNGDRNYEPHAHSDGGYALIHRWM